MTPNPENKPEHYDPYPLLGHLATSTASPFPVRSNRRAESVPESCEKTSSMVIQQKEESPPLRWRSILLPFPVMPNSPHTSNEEDTKVNEEMMFETRTGPTEGADDAKTNPKCFPTNKRNETGIVTSNPVEAAKTTDVVTELP